ncbi:MAG: hypothetical protein HOQ34_12385 [Gemmatimonadaceae bacterium]|nr:hypothetical protein [Gemmatimonadaceae bacterium]
MRTTRRSQSPSLTPPGSSTPAQHVDREADAPQRAPVSYTPNVTLAMRIQHRYAAAPSGFMSAEERAFVEHRRSGCD